MQLEDANIHSVQRCMKASLSLRRITTGFDKEGESMPQRFVVLCFVALSSAVWCNAAEQRSALCGQWEGAVQIPGYELRLVIDLAQQGQGWVGSLTVPEFGVKGAPLTGIAVKENDVEFGFKGGATIKGHLETDGVLRGEYKQGGNSAPFLLKRVDRKS